MSHLAKTTTIKLGAHFDKFVEEQVANGRYESPEDVVRAGLRLVEEQEARLEALRAALIEGEQSGLATPFDFDEFLEEMHRSHALGKCANTPSRARREMI